MNCRIASMVLILALAASAPAFLALAEEPTDPVPLARSFVERFLAGEYDRFEDLMSDEMKAAFTPTRAEQIAQQILSTNGAVKSIGDPWLEDEIQGFRRFRVPAEFENGTVDLRVVFDGSEKVTGFFQVPHVPSPAEMAADESLRAAPNPEVEGVWSGKIELPGLQLAVQVELSFADGRWTGNIDIPLQGATDIPLSGLAIAGNDVRFSIEGVPGDPTFHGKLREGSIGGDFEQSGQRFPFSLAREELAEPARPQEPQPPFPYAEHEIRFKNGEIALAGTLTVPEGEGPFPAALLISGSGPQDRNEEVFGHKPFLVLADHLTRAGIAVLRVDDRGFGESGGSTEDATSEDFAADALAGVEFLLGRDEIDPKRIGLIGHSEGGIIAPKVAAATDGVAFVVLLAAPGVPGGDLLVRQVELLARAAGSSDEQVAEAAAAQADLVKLVRSGAEEEAVRAKVRTLVQSQAGGSIDEDALEVAVTQQTAQLTTPWFRYFLAYDPRPALRKLGVPVLALFGEKDLQVEPRQNLPEIRQALEQGGNQDVTAEELKGLNHLFQTATTGSISEYYTIEETMSPVVLEKIATWIGERTRGGP